MRHPGAHARRPDTPAQAWRLAQGWYGNKLHPEWRRHTLDETEALLASIGLTGDFWNLRG